MRFIHTKTAAAVMAFLVPVTAVAATLQAENSIAGIGLSIDLLHADANKNVEITVSDPDGGTIRIPVVADTKGTATAVLPGSKAETAGTYTVSAPGASPIALEVTPDSVDAQVSSVQTWTPVISPDGRDRAEVSVILRDRYGNTLSGRPVTLVASRTSDKVTPLSPETDATGTQHFSVTATEEGTIQLRAIDLLSAVTIGETAQIRAGSTAMGGEYAPLTSYTASNTSGKKFYFNAQAVSSFDIIDGFEVTAPMQMTAGEEAQKVTVRAVDRNGVTVENYTGTVRFVTTDPQATVPNFGTYTFLSRDLGVKSFPLALTFRSPGEQTFRVEDETDATIVGETVISVSGQGGVGPTGGLEVTSHKDGDYVNSLDLIVEGIGPRFVNLIVIGGDRDYTGSTDDMGRFTIPIALAQGRQDYTLRVRNDLGTYDSGNIHLVLDQDAPEISMIQFAPEAPEEGTKVLVVVESEPGLSNAFLRIPDRVNSIPQDVELVENTTQPGSYQGFFTAPASGSYQPIATVMDKAGNVTELATQLQIGGKTLPQVQGLKAEPKVDAVDLTWDPVTSDVTGYRIYIGDSEDNYLYTLDTGRVITKATVKGLTQGQVYTFAVTALRDEIESEEKSVSVSAQVLGFKLEVTPQDGALRVQWTSLANDLPLQTFILEYGTTETDLSEKRTLNGDLRDYTIRDLLNGVEYFIRVTPVTITGDTLDELSASGQGTPEGGLFKPSARDDVPFDIDDLPAGPLHSGAPNNPSTGVPAAAWMTVLALAAFGVFLRWKHRKHVAQTDAFLRAVQAQYHM